MKTENKPQEELNVFKNEEQHVVRNDKKKYLAKFIKMLVEKGHDIEEYMGKPLSHYDYNGIYKIVTEWEEEKQKNDFQRANEIRKSMGKEVKETGSKNNPV